MATGDFWNDAAIFFAIVIPLFAVLLWLFGDPDRSENIYLRVARHKDALWAAFAAVFAANQFIEHDWLLCGMWVLVAGNAIYAIVSKWRQARS